MFVFFIPVLQYVSVVSSDVCTIFKMDILEKYLITRVSVAKIVTASPL